MGKLFDKLDHKEELSAWIAYYGGDEDNYHAARGEAANLETLMRYWEDSKSKYLYDLLGKKFVIEKEISFEVPKEKIADKIYTELYNGEDMYDFYSNFISWIETLVTRNRISWRQYIDLKSLVKTEVLAENKYEGHLIKLDVNGTSITIQNGCKPSKILRKIAEAANLEGFERFRIAHSNILAEKTQKGILCLSIHPLDYITMSDNTYSWDSCMNWRDAGCYRIGTVEMMNSPCVVMAYIKGKESMRFGEFKWNSKKWRNLFIVTEDFICGIKGYPYQSTKFDEICIETLRDLAKKNLNFSYCEDIIEHHFSYQSESIYISELDKNVSFRFETTYMYPDFGNSNNTHLIVSPNICNSITCNYSGQPICMHCGTELSGYNYDSNDCSSLMCEECLPSLRCEICGERIDPDDGYELEGMTVCSECYFDRRVYDPFDGDYHYDGNTNRVYLVSNKYVDENCLYTKEEALYRFSNFNEVFPRMFLWEGTCDTLPVEKYYFSQVKTYFDEVWVYIIDLDKIKDESLKNRIAEIFDEYGE